MPSKEEEENKQQKSRARQGQSRPTQPGAKASTAPQRSGDEKTRTSTLPPELENLERSIAEKKRPNAPATTPGAFNATQTGREDLSNLEADVMAKQRGRDVALTPQKAKTDGATSKAASRIGRDLDQLERDVNAKIQRENTATPRRTEKKAAPTSAGAIPMSLDRLEQQIVAKQSPSSPLNELEKRVASKNATPESVTPRGLHDAEASVSKKESAGGETPMMESSLPGQKGGVGLGLNESQQKFDEDLEYGEYGGPDEQGLAVAFEIEETDDVYIPSAVEFDPDAKPPMVKNRRFRLYFILTVVVVVVGSIGAAIGMTISARKTKQGIPYRETIGIKESVERLVGSAVLEDPSSPYSKALDWITYQDPKQMVPGDGRFKQRYSVAVFYFATSTKNEWSGGCGPAKTEEERETSHCIYTQPIDAESSRTKSHDSKRWFSNSDECGWYGLRCDEFGQIRTMSFHYTNMTGTIPEVLKMFTYVQSIQFKFQSLEGTIPGSVFELEHLVNVDFSYNSLNGTIPESAYTKSMQRILLAGNSLTGSISSSIAKLNDLKTFTLFRNKMVGPIPTEIGLLQNIQYLRVGRNEFTGTIPTEIGNLHSLFDVSLQRMHFTGSLPSEIVHLTRLSDLRISHNKITGTIPDGFYNMTALTRIDFQGNMMEGTISPRIGQMNLKDVQLYSNKFSGTIPSEISVLPKLNLLELRGNRFTGSVPAGLCPEERGANGLRNVGKITAECSVDESTGAAPHTCTCCNWCCTNGGEDCEESGLPTSSFYREVDEDEHLGDTFQ